MSTAANVEVAPAVWADACTAFRTVEPWLGGFMAVLTHPSQADGRYLVCKTASRGVHHRIPLGHLDTPTFLLLLEWVDEWLWERHIKTLIFDMTQDRWAWVRHELAWPLTTQVVDSVLWAIIDDLVLGIGCNSPETAGALQGHIY